MKAEVGDWLVMKGVGGDQPGQRGLITEVHSDDGSPPYVVHWLDSDHVATVFPGPDAIIVRSLDQRAAAKRTRRRIASVQAEIVHDFGSN